MLEPLCNIFADIRPAILSKRDFRTGFLLRTWRNLSEHLFYRTLPDDCYYERLPTVVFPCLKLLSSNYFGATVTLTYSPACL